MGSKSWSETTAIDNRLAVTDSGFGLSSSGSGNQTALNGPIINLSANSTGGAKSGAGNGGTISLNLLDGGAVAQSFDFARSSLSEMLASVLNGQKATLTAQTQQADTISQALATQAAAQAEAQRASAQIAANATTAAAATNAATADKVTTWLADNGKKLLIGGGLVLGAWWVWKKGKK